jgi:hypothetical protein
MGGGSRNARDISVAGRGTRSPRQDLSHEYFCLPPVPVTLVTALEEFGVCTLASSG